MTQSIQDKRQEEKKQKKQSKFDNLFLDMLYNIVAWLPVTIITWFLSNIDF